MTNPAIDNVELFRRQMAMAMFATLFAQLLRAEAAAIAVDTNVLDVVGIHNIFEDARNEIVRTYLPLKFEKSTL